MQNLSFLSSSNQFPSLLNSQSTFASLPFVSHLAFILWSVQHTPMQRSLSFSSPLPRMPFFQNISTYFLPYFLLKPQVLYQWIRLLWLLSNSQRLLTRFLNSQESCHIPHFDHLVVLFFCLLSFLHIWIPHLNVSMEDIFSLDLYIYLFFWEHQLQILVVLHCSTENQDAHSFRKRG